MLRKLMISQNNNNYVTFQRASTTASMEDAAQTDKVTFIKI